MVDEIVEKNQSVKQQSKPNKWGLRIIVLFIFLGALYMAINYHPGFPKRARVYQSLFVAQWARLAIIDYFNEYHHFPSNNFDAGLAGPSDVKSSGMNRLEISTIGRGKEAKALMTLTFNKKVDEGKTLIYSISISQEGGKFIMDCKGGTLLKQYRPAECR